MEVQDIDIARFIPKEVDNAGITVASADRFAAKAPPTNDTDGETLLNIFLSMTLHFLCEIDCLYSCTKTNKK